MDQSIFNDRLRQILLLILIVCLIVLLFTTLKIFIPGILGGITIYILSRNSYFQLIFKRKWKKGWTALLYILGYLVIIAIPIYLTVTLVTPKIEELLHNQDAIMVSVQNFSDRVEGLTGFKIFTSENIKSLSQKLSGFIPTIINSTLSIITNLMMMFFLSYYLLVNGRDVEKMLGRLIPLKPKNINSLASETRMMVKANAIGIPIICIIQGLFATLGYWIFGVEDWALWGFVTGVMAYFPLVGTMIVWVPLVIMILSNGDTFNGVGLLIFSLIVTGNVDYVARLSLLKKIGDVHPLVTVIGVVVGLQLFGFVGLIFGPLLISYILVLIRIYFNEFATSSVVLETPGVESPEEKAEKESFKKE